MQPSAAKKRPLQMHSAGSLCSPSCDRSPMQLPVLSARHSLGLLSARCPSARSAAIAHNSKGLTISIGCATGMKLLPGLPPSCCFLGLIARFAFQIHRPAARHAGALRQAAFWQHHSVMLSHFIAQSALTMYLELKPAGGHSRTCDLDL